MSFHPNEVAGRGSEGGHEKVNKSDSAMSQALSGKVMSELHKPGDPSAWPRMSDLTTGKDHIQFKPEAPAAKTGAVPQPMKLEGAMMATDTRPGNLMSQSGKHAFDTVHQAATTGEGINNIKDKQPQQQNVHQVADAGHDQKKRAS